MLEHTIKISKKEFEEIINFGLEIKHFTKEEADQLKLKEELTIDELRSLIKIQNIRYECATSFKSCLKHGLSLLVLGLATASASMLFFCSLAAPAAIGGLLFLGCLASITVVAATFHYASSKSTPASLRGTLEILKKIGAEKVTNSATPPKNSDNTHNQEYTYSIFSNNPTTSNSPQSKNNIPIYKR